MYRSYVDAKHREIVYIMYSSIYLEFLRVICVTTEIAMATLKVKIAIINLIVRYHFKTLTNFDI